MIDLGHDVLRQMLTLRQVPLLATSELGELAMIAENVREVAFERGATVGASGESPAALHVVVSGCIASQSMQTRWAPRQVFGALELLAGRPLLLPAIAVEPTQTLELGAQDIEDLLAENPGMLRQVLRQLAIAMMVGGAAAPAAIAAAAAEPLGFVDRLAVLRGQPVYAGARLDALAVLAQTSEEVAFLPGDLIARAGELVTATYLVVDGEIHLEHDELRRSAGPGAALAVIESLASGPHRGTARANTRVRVLAWEPTVLFDVIEDHPHLGRAVIASLASWLLDHARTDARTDAP
jgi:CRP-like cAMP-binding protein